MRRTCQVVGCQNESAPNNNTMCTMHIQMLRASLDRWSKRKDQDGAR